MKNLNNKTVKQSMKTIVKLDKITSVLEDKDFIRGAISDFETKKVLLKELSYEVNYKLKGDAWADIKGILKMYTHIGKSMNEYGMDIPQLRHYGFNEGTIHHVEYQKQKMTEQERKDMPWRYTDKNPKSLVKQLVMSEYYYAHVDTSDLSISIPKDHLMELVSIASRYE